MKIISREWGHYKTLSEKTRLLVSSFALRSIAHPLLTLFINSFIWRSTSSLPSVAMYNLGFFIILPIGFYVNGLLLKRVKITKLYFVGSIISTISTIAIIFFSGSRSWHFLVYGFVYGFGSGLYWANRNFLSFQETKSKDRNYFFSITSVIGSLIAIVVTFFMGWLIVLGENSSLYTPTMAYWIFGILAAVVLIASGVIVLKTDYKSPAINHLFKRHITPKWNGIRLVSFTMGLLEGIAFFLPTVLILFYLGKEGVLGTINTIVTLFIVTATYLYGRMSKQNHRKPIYFVALVLYIICAALLILLENPTNILIFVLLGGIIAVFQWITIEPAILDVMDEETNRKVDNRYTFILDQELFLNFG
ncbi:MFS transporter, partial [Patescibacteria group bacterium]|nr:MFS transporter [Patescibacteria group bacterium]